MVQAMGNVRDYIKHQELWLPDDLQTGDIIQCQMLTLHDGIEKAEICPRKVMILGFELDPVLLDYTAIHVARFSHTNKYCRDDKSFLFTQPMARRGHITGLDIPVVMQIDRTDFIPLTQDHFWGDVVDVVRLGRVDPALFQNISDSLKAGHATSNASTSRYPARNTAQWYLPAMHLAGQEMQNPHFSEGYTELSEVDLARIHLDCATRKDPQKLDGAYIMECLSRMDAATRALARQLNWQSRHKKCLSVHEPFVRVNGASSQSEISNHDLECIAPEPEAVSPEESFLMLMPRADAGEKIEGLRGLMAKFNEEAVTSAFRLQFPSHLWQGRYLMLKVPDLLDDANDGMAFRPCAVWKAYADKDTQELVGLELHPVTRSGAKHFQYKLPVYPVPTRSEHPSFLVADCIIRVPLEERYFHEIPSQFFFELPPDKLEKFKIRREYAMTSENPVHVYGLKAIPENWVEVELDPTPSYQQFRKWSESRQIRFDGAVTDKVRERQMTRGFRKGRSLE